MIAGVVNDWEKIGELSTSPTRVEPSNVWFSGVAWKPAKPRLSRADTFWLPATKFIFSGMITEWTVVEPPPRGSDPTIVIGYVTWFVGSVYWNVQCGIVVAFWRNCDGTPPCVVNSGRTSAFAWPEAPDAADAARAAASTTMRPSRSRSMLRWCMKLPPHLLTSRLETPRKPAEAAEYSALDQDWS